MRHTREEVIGRVVRVFEALDQVVANLTDEQWSRPLPRPETEDPWTVKDGLAHITYWREVTVRDAREQPSPAEEDGLDSEGANHMIYERWKDKTPQEVLAWHRQVQEELVAALRAAPDKWFGGQEQDEPWPYDVDGHVTYHLTRDLEHALKNH